MSAREALRRPDPRIEAKIAESAKRATEKSDIEPTPGNLGALAMIAMLTMHGGGVVSAKQPRTPDSTKTRRTS